MKTCLGLFLIGLSFNISANSVQLVLRARVPASYKVVTSPTHTPLVVTNQITRDGVKITKNLNFYRVTIAEP